MRRTATIPVAAIALVLMCGGPILAQEQEPIPAPIAAPVTIADPVGDAPEGGPDIVAVTVSEPWQSLVSISVEFAAEPALGYDLEKMLTDELWVGLATTPEATAIEEFEYLLGVHGATLSGEVETGATLFDTTRPAGDEVLWRVVDVEVAGPAVTLFVDRKLVGDPDELYFFAAVSTDGEPGYDICPDEDELPGEYSMLGLGQDVPWAGLGQLSPPGEPVPAAWPRCP